jgi:hypothetical protein
VPHHKALESLESRWIQLFDDLRCDTTMDPNEIAAPFLSVRTADRRSILYVGKATAKDWYKDDSPNWVLNLDSTAGMAEKISERYGCTEEFLREYAPTYRSGFWDFARDLNAQAAKKWKTVPDTPLQHITWTNIFKIGALIGNPKVRLRARQEELAIETLRTEILVYEPEIIYFATGDYGDDIVGRVLEDPNRTLWDQSKSTEGLWWRGSMDGLPPVIWTYHPQGKSRQQRDTWLNRALGLLPE